MKKTFSFLVTMLATMVLLTGCATLLGGGAKQKVSIGADQSKATFLIKDQIGNIVFEGKDPGQLLLARKYTYTVEVSLEGYATQTVMISQGINGWFWGNLCFGGIIGGAIDFVTGSMWELQPSKVNIRMKTAMTKTENGYLVTFYTRDDNGDLRSLDFSLAKT